MRSGLLLVIPLLLAPSVAGDAALGGTRSDAGWILIEVRSVTGPFRAAITPQFDGPGMVGIDVMGPSGPLPNVRGIWPAASYEVVVAPLPEPARLANRPGGIGVAWNAGHDPALYRVLLWSAGNVITWTWTFEPKGGEVLRVEESDRVLFLDGSETTGLHAHAAASGYGASLSNASYTVDVEHDFVGIAGWQRTSRYQSLEIEPMSRITHLDPSGAMEMCECASPRIAPGRPMWGPGTHTILWEGHEVHTALNQPILLAGADAPLTW